MSSAMLTHRTMPLPQAAVATNFCNAAVIVRSWYVAMRSNRLRAGRVVAVDMLRRRLVFWRDHDGDVHAMDAYCAHLGADLGQATVVDGAIRCPFHHWRFAADGRCIDAPCEARTPRRAVRTYPVAEKHGLVWVYNGLRPAFEVPDFTHDDQSQRYRRVIVPSLHLNCHPHLAIANGLDVTHLDKLHGLRISSAPVFDEPSPHRLRLTTRGRPQSPWVRWIAGARKREVVATFTAIGCSIGWLTFSEPVRFHTMFTARLDSGDGCDTQTVIYLPRGVGLRPFRAAMTLLSLLHADRAILNAIRFRPDFADSDDAQRRFAELVNAMEVES